MHIIFDESVDEFKDRFTVLELDTFKLTDTDQVVTAYCVVEKIPLTELPNVDRQCRMHEHLIQNYRKKNWSFCEQALEQLIGKWNCEVDTFYKSLSDRVTEFKNQDPGDSWTGVLAK